jgi:hypothetical protein
MDAMTRVIQIYDAKDSIVASLMDFAESEECVNVLNALYKKKSPDADRKPSLVSAKSGSGGLATSDLLSLAKSFGAGASVGNRANLLPPIAAKLVTDER